MANTSSRTLSKILCQQETTAKCSRLSSWIRKSSGTETEKGTPEKRVTTRTTKSSSCHRWSKLRKTGRIEPIVCPALAISAAWMELITKRETTVWFRDSNTDTCCHCLREELQIKYIASSSPNLQLMLNCSRGSPSTRASSTLMDNNSTVLEWFRDKVIKMADQFRWATVWIITAKETRSLPDFQIFNYKIR